MVQIISLARPLSHAGEDRVSTMSFGHVIDELHNEYGFAHASTTE